jgi:hypothetical protein
MDKNDPFSKVPDIFVNIPNNPIKHLPRRSKDEFIKDFTPQIYNPLQKDVEVGPNLELRGYLKVAGSTTLSGTTNLAVTNISNTVTITGTSGATLTVDNSLLTHNMTLREIDVCSGGTTKKMLILASVPY